MWVPDQRGICNSSVNCSNHEVYNHALPRVVNDFLHYCHVFNCEQFKWNSRLSGGNKELILIPYSCNVDKFSTWLIWLLQTKSYISIYNKKIYRYSWSLIREKILQIREYDSWCFEKHRLGVLEICHLYSMH